MYQCTKFDVHQAKDYQDVERSVLSYFQFDLWHIDLKTQKGYQFFKMYCVQSLMSVKERVFKILSGQYIHMPSLIPWPLSSESKVVIYFHDVLVYKVWCLSSKGFSRYWVISIFKCPVWPLHLWHFNLIIKSGHLLSMTYKFTQFDWLFTVSSSRIFSLKLRVFKILSDQYIPMSSFTA
jgi:hypothetical protein